MSRNKQKQARYNNINNITHRHISPDFNKKPKEALVKNQSF